MGGTSGPGVPGFGVPGPGVGSEGIGVSSHSVPGANVRAGGALQRRPAPACGPPQLLPA